MVLAVRQALAAAPVENGAAAVALEAARRLDALALHLPQHREFAFQLTRTPEPQRLEQLFPAYIRHASVLRLRDAPDAAAVLAGYADEMSWCVQQAALAGCLAPARLEMLAAQCEDFRSPKPQDA